MGKKGTNPNDEHAMFEVEKKFILSESEEERLLKGATMLNQKTFTDVYVDTDQFLLTAKDWWLRSRDGKWELKIPLNKGKRAARVADQYQELENEEEICQALGFLERKNLKDLLVLHGLHPFCTCTTTRKKFQKGPFTIDFDTVTYPDTDFTYRLLEVELLVEWAEEMDTAVKKILDFAKREGLLSLPVRGKVVVYLEHEKPKHFQALVTAGVVVKQHYA
jgi:thiamine-triphosphatase